MSYRSCPDWPELMEIAPDLQFKHYSVREAQLPAEALMLEATGRPICSCRSFQENRRQPSYFGNRKR